MDQEFTSNFVKQALELWINPEIKRRKEQGTWPDDFVAYAIQVIFDDEMEMVQVRFNEEVKAVFEVDFAKEVNAGDPVAIEDINNIKNVQLTDHDPNAGHLTIMRHREGWFIGFDFTRNVTRSQLYLDASREFVRCAEVALTEEMLRAFLDNIHSAAELVAKGLLIMHDSSLLKSKSHGHVSTRYNLWGHLGNVDPKHTKLLNDAQRLRSSARYLSGELRLTKEEAEDMLGMAKRMIDDLDARIQRSKRADVISP